MFTNAVFFLISLARQFLTNKRRSEKTPKENNRHSAVAVEDKQCAGTVQNSDRQLILLEGHWKCRKFSRTVKMQNFF